jgi:hypothetical protein
MSNPTQSGINANTIDATYPVAGQDNDSQGFRNNFSAIKTALLTATSEITNLQLITAVKNDTNDFDGNLLQNAILQNVGEYATNSVTVNANPWTLYYNSANYYQMTISTSTSFIIDNWPASSILGKMRLAITPTTSSFATTMTFEPAIPGGQIWKEGNTSLPFSLGTMTNRTTVFDLWTTDGGETTFVKFIGTYTGT